MMQCPPVPPMNITISIDLGSMFGNPGAACKLPEPPCDEEGKITYFNENNKGRGGFGGAVDNVCRAAGCPEKKENQASEKQIGPGPNSGSDEPKEKSPFPKKKEKEDE